VLSLWLSLVHSISQSHLYRVCLPTRLPAGMDVGQNTLQNTLMALPSLTALNAVPGLPHIVGLAIENVMRSV